MGPDRQNEVFPYWEGTFKDNSRLEIIGIGLKAPLIQSQQGDDV